MFCFAFEYHLQYELSKSPLFVILPNLQKIGHVLRAISTKVTLEFVLFCLLGNILRLNI